MKHAVTKQVIDEILEDESEHQELVRVSVTLSKNVYERFKRRCGSVPVSRALDRILRRLLKDEAA